MGLSTEQMVAATYEAVQRIDKALYGNGQPGLIQKVAAIEEWKDSTEREETNEPSWKQVVLQKQGNWLSVIAILVTIGLALHDLVR